MREDNQQHANPPGPPGSRYSTNVGNVTDPNFTANSDYEFRVFDDNAVGKSEPSLGSNLIKVQEVSDGSAPEFVRGPHNVSVGLGKTLSLETEVSEPSWSPVTAGGASS